MRSGMGWRKALIRNKNKRVRVALQLGGLLVICLNCMSCSDLGGLP